MSNAMEQTRAMVDKVCGKENPYPKEISESDFETASEDEDEDEEETTCEPRR